jgi:hypothetical protein
MIRAGAVAVLVLAGAALACGASPTAPKNAKASEPFTLAPGQSAIVEGTGIEVGFVGVSDDSRCPVDVTCVWAGDATVKLWMRQASPERTEAELHVNPPGKTTYQGHRIVLTGLEPQPHSGQAIDSGKYRVTLKVEPSASTP